SNCLVAQVPVSLFSADEVSMRSVSRIAWLLVVTAVLLIGPGPLAAADTFKEDSKAKAGDAHGKAGNGAHAAPKERDVFEFRGDLGIWTLVVFLGLFFLLRKYAWGPILEGLHKREAGIKGAISEAENLRAESANLKEQFATQMAQAGEKVRGIMEDA